jgi:hypothetical protein
MRHTNGETGLERGSRSLATTRRFGSKRATEIEMIMGHDAFAVATDYIASLKT